MQRRAIAVVGVLLAGCGDGELRPAATLPPAAGPANVQERTSAVLDRAGSHDERLVVAGRRGEVRVRGWVSGAASSPDGGRVALGVGDTGDVQLVDLRRMRQQALIPTTAGAPLVEVAWPAGDRVLAVSGGRPGDEGVLLDVDPRSGAVRWSRDLDGAVLAARGGPRDLVAVLGPPGDVGEARLLHVDRGGRARTWPLPGVAGGAVVDASRGHELRERLPGLAVSDADARAFVVAPGRGLRIVEVDLRAGRRVTHDVPSPRRSAAGQVRGVLDGLVEEAEAKAGKRAWRQAHWLGRGRLAVTGVDEAFDHAAGRQRVTPVGLRIVDVRTWTQRLVDRGASYLVAAGGGVATGDGIGDRHGVRVEARSGSSSRGIRLFGPDGRERWRHVAGTQVIPSFARGRLLHVLDHRTRHAPRMVALDVATGRRATRPVPPGRVDAPLP